jgi:hypothetical protein
MNFFIPHRPVDRKYFGVLDLQLYQSHGRGIIECLKLGAARVGILPMAIRGLLTMS